MPTAMGESAARAVTKKFSPAVAGSCWGLLCCVCGILFFFRFLWMYSMLRYFWLYHLDFELSLCHLSFQSQNGDFCTDFISTKWVRAEAECDFGGVTTVPHEWHFKSSDFVPYPLDTPNTKISPHAQ